MKVTAKDLTASLLSNLRFTKQMLMVASEVGAFSSDVLAIDPDKGKFIEVEVKISKSDLMADFKKLKHEYYLKLFREKEYLKVNRSWKYYSEFIPKQFFFCVPEEMLAYTLETCEDLPYGVICYRGSHPLVSKRVRIEKRAKKLHDGKVPVRVIHTTLKRMSSELCNFHIESVKRK